MSGPAVALRPLGDTGLEVSAVGLGLAALGRPGYLNLGHGEDLGDDRDVEALAARSREVLDAAWAAGVRYVDAARSYGLAERFLAGWLDANPRAEGVVVVGSKWGYAYTAGWRVDAAQHEVKEHSPRQLERQLAETRRELGDRVDLYQVHSATLDSGVLDDRAVLARLVALADEGVVVGLTTSGPRQADTVRRALEAEVDGRNPFRCVQATWNLLEPSVAPALAEAAGAGWGVIVKEAVANGRLTPRGDVAGDGRLAAAARRHGADVDAVAIAAVLAQPWAHVVLSGAATVGQLHANLGALDVALEPDELAELAGLAEEPVAYWSRRGELPWT